MNVPLGVWKRFWLVIYERSRRDEMTEFALRGQDYGWMETNRCSRVVEEVVV